MSPEAYIVDALRTPMGRAHKGRMAHARPDDMGAFIVRELLARYPRVKPERIDDVIAATAFPEAEQGYNLGRVVALLSGLPDSVPGMQLNRWCASGLEAVATANAKILTGIADCVVAVGVESMTAVPMGGHDFTPNPQLASAHPDMYLGMGLTAENLVDRHRIPREEQDRFALQSHERALAAEARGAWNDERVPFPLTPLTGVDGDVLAIDEGPRAGTTLEALASLKPVFRADGTVTAGNSSPLTDGAAAVLLVSRELRDELDLPVLGRLVSYAAAGVPPEIMGIGPVAAVPKALEKAGWQQDELQTIELNEAFAAQSLAVIGELGLDEARVNPQGGAIALGHPLGCTGTRLVATLLHQMKREGQEKGMATMCVGGGMGAAGCFTRDQ
jgi:acetyl-CoA acyltransferase